MHHEKPLYTMTRRVEDIAIRLRLAGKCGGEIQDRYHLELFMQAHHLTPDGYVVDNLQIQPHVIQALFPSDATFIGSCEFIAGSVVNYLRTLNPYLTFVRVTVDQGIGGTIGVAWQPGQSLPYALSTALPIDAWIAEAEAQGVRL